MKWLISFDQNGGEYTGFLEVTGKQLAWVQPCIFVVDGVEVKLDERTQEVEIISNEESHPQDPPATP